MLAEPEDPEVFAQRTRVAFGDNVRAARTAAGLTQEALGHRSGLHPTEINRMERGRRNPGIITVARLAGGLGLPASDLLNGI